MNHDIMDYISAGAAVAWLCVGLFMKASLGDIKLIIRDVRGILDTHVATDDVKHAAIERRIERLEGNQ